MNATLPLFAAAPAVLAGLLLGSPPGPASSEPPIEDPITWTVTGGPTFGTKPFDDGSGGTITAPAVSITGKIDPPLPPGTTGNPTAAKLKGCPDGTPTDTGPLEFQGGANGGSFTFDVKRSELNSDCPQVGITYTLYDSGETVEVCFSNPRFRRVSQIDFGVGFQLAQDSPLTFPVYIMNQDGQVDSGYDGAVRVSASSLHGSRVLLNNAFGSATVRIQSGVGSIEIECVRAIEGDTLIFDLTGRGRLDASRSSVDVL